MHLALFLAALLRTVASGSFSDYSNWDYYHEPVYDRRPTNEKYDGCTEGMCLRMSDCPWEATAAEPSGHCAHLDNGPWVCCIYKNSDGTRLKADSAVIPTKDTNVPKIWKDTKPTESSWNRHENSNPAWKKTEDPWYQPSTKENLPKTSKDNWNIRTTPKPERKKTEDTWHRPSTNENLPKTTVGSWNRRTTSKPKWEKTKEPWHQSSANEHFPRTTENSWNGRVTPEPDWKKTEDSWHRPPTNEHLPKTTKDNWSGRTTSKPQWKKTEDPWHRPSTRDNLSKTTEGSYSRRTTSKPVWKRTDDPWHKPSADEYLPGTTKNSWGGHTTFKPQRDNFSKTTEGSYNRRTTTKSAWKKTEDPWSKTTEVHWNKHTTHKPVKKTEDPWHRPSTEYYPKTAENTWNSRTTPEAEWKESEDPWHRPMTNDYSTKTTGDKWTKYTTSKPTSKTTKNSWFWPTSKEPKIKFETESSKRVSISTKHSWVASTAYPSTRSTKFPTEKVTPNLGNPQPTRSPAENTLSSTLKLVHTKIPKRPTPQWSATKKPTVVNSTRTNSFLPGSGDKGVASLGKPTQSSNRRTPTPRGQGKPTLPGSNRQNSTKTPATTTSVPYFNPRNCGIRGNSRNSARNSDYRNPVADIIYPGSSTVRTRNPYMRIVGGKEAEPYSWPWVAALYKVNPSGGNRFLSAGSLISENFVLTAAHIFTPDDLRSSSFVVMLGTHASQNALGQYTVSEVLQHPRYRQRLYYHDIALLRLERPVRYSDYILPVCLPPAGAREEDIGRRVTVVGWGDDSYGGKSSPVLKEANVRVISRRTCNASYTQVASNRFPEGITEQMLCAGHPEGGRDACQGDSGGPLTSEENGRYVQVGIVSFGFRCGDKEYPGVYTRVAPYVRWIAQITQLAERSNNGR